MKYLLCTLLFLTACTSSHPEIKSIGVVTTKPTSASEVTEIPVAVITPQEGVVLSPYYPFELLDVSGLPSGMIVKDPTSGLLVRVP